MAFEGPAVEDGVIDVSDLAPALLALGDLFQTSNRILNGQSVTTRLSVRAQPRAGCFEIDLEVAVSLGAQLKAFLIGDGPDTADRLFKLIIGGSGAAASLIALFRLLKGKKPSSTTTLEDGNVQITVNNETNVFSKHVIQLYNDPHVRDSISKVGLPLRSERVERIEFREDGHMIESVSRVEAEYLGQIEDQESAALEAFDRTVVLQVITATFDDTRLWRMSDGSTTFNVGIEDEDFLADVDERRATFGKGDVLRVDMHSEQSINSSGNLQTRHTIVKVREKLTMPEQIPLLPNKRD